MLLRDRYAQLWHDRHGVATVPLRYCNIYGMDVAGETLCGLPGTFVRQLTADGSITVFGDGRQTRDFVHVDDVVRATIGAATTRRVGKAYTVGSGESTSVRTVARLVRDHVDPSAEIDFDEEYDGAVRDSHADISNARAWLDFEPTRSIEGCLGDRIAGVSR